MTKTTKINIFSENIYTGWDINEKKYLDRAKKILRFYLDKIKDKSCLAGVEYDTISFDFLYCDSEKTHEINKEYRNKDYPADIITFAIFADDENKGLDYCIKLRQQRKGIDENKLTSTYYNCQPLDYAINTLVMLFKSA